MTADEARGRFARSRVARLATTGLDARPHLVPFVFAVDGDTVYHAVDHKPKRTQKLKRLDNIAANPHVAVLADEYDDADWERLWWVRGDGVARIVRTDSEEAAVAVRLLRERYAQYREQAPQGPLIAVDVQRWSGWCARRR